MAGMKIHIPANMNEDKNIQIHIKILNLKAKALKSSYFSNRDGNCSK